MLAQSLTFRTLSTSALLLSLGWSPAASATSVFTTQLPEGTYADGPYELGMKWESSVSGVITHMRFYRPAGEAEDGGEFAVHTGHIWDAQGNLLATVPFAGAAGRTGEGWESVALFQPLAIDANTPYVVSVNVVNQYVATHEELSVPVVNAPLSSIADGNNGVFSTTPGAFPTQSWLNSNYYVDVSVEGDELPASATVMTSQEPEGTYNDGPYELGMKFTSSEAGTITRMRFFRAANEAEDGGEFAVHTGHIWDEDGNLLASVPFAGAAGRTGEGWESVALFHPLAIDADTVYVVSVNIVNDYVATHEELSLPISNGPLSSIADGNNGVFSTTPGAFPTASWFNSNYYVDVEVSY